MKPEIIWDEKYAIGVSTIDRAHQELFTLTNILVRLADNNEKLEWVGKEGVEFLKGYVMKHFGEEEAYMRSVSYPDMEAHIAQHHNLRDNVLPIIALTMQADEYSQDSVYRLLRTLQNWLRDHIIAYDTKLAVK